MEQAYSFSYALKDGICDLVDVMASGLEWSFGDIAMAYLYF